MKACFSRLCQDSAIRRLAVIAALASLAFVLVVSYSGVGLEDLKAAWAVTRDFLERHPLWFYVALVILPGFPVPTSVLLFLAGTIWRETPVIGCFVALSAIILNMAWCHWLSSGPARGVAEWLLKGRELPTLANRGYRQFTAIVRLTPGIPMFLQNYLLGFLQVPFWPYLVVSICCNSMLTIGAVLAGAGLASGNVVPAITGVGLLVVGSLAVKAVHSKLTSTRRG